MARPKARTHDTSLADYHVKDIETFARAVTNATAAAFPKHGRSKYKRVHVLLLSWIDDDLGVINEVLELQQAFEMYSYDAEEFKIPSKDSYKLLRKKLSRFLDENEGEDHLLIFYYGGHGYIDDERQCVWQCKQTEDTPVLRWSGLQQSLEENESDVLILLDCCAAASSAAVAGCGVTEMIAACGFEAFAPAPGEHSFTRGLVDELVYCLGRGPPLSVAVLHSKIISNMKSWRPRSDREAVKKFLIPPERKKTPIHIMLGNEVNEQSIILTPMNNSGVGTPYELAGSVISGPMPSEMLAPVFNKDDASVRTGQISKEQTPDPKMEDPTKVLISLHLEEDQMLSTNDWVKWLKSVPALVVEARVEGIFHGHSSLILLSLPVATWDMLPKDPAVSFVGFVRSRDLVKKDLEDQVDNLRYAFKNDPWTVYRSRYTTTKTSKIVNRSENTMEDEAAVFSQASTAETFASEAPSLGIEQQDQKCK